jgi:hypothetical protein
MHHVKQAHAKSDWSAVRRIAVDAYLKGAIEHFPYAGIVFDKFHVMVLAGKALDEVRRELQREGTDLKGSMWTLRGNSWNLSEDCQAQRENLSRQYTKLGRAMSLRLTLQAIYASSERQVAEAELDWWCGWAAQSLEALPRFGQDRSRALGWDPSPTSPIRGVCGMSIVSRSKSTQAPKKSSLQSPIWPVGRRP